MGSTGLRSKKKSRKSKVRGTAFILKKATFFGGEDRYQGIDYRVKTPYQRDAIPSATGSLTLTRLPPSAGLHFTLKIKFISSFFSGKRAVPDYIFDPTRLLQQRQFRYQICDIRLEEVEGLLKESEISSECTVHLHQMYIFVLFFLFLRRKTAGLGVEESLRKLDRRCVVLSIA